MPRDAALPDLSIARRLSVRLRRPDVLALLPSLMLGAYWLGGEQVLIAVAVGVPLMLAVVGAIAPIRPRPAPPIDGATGLVLRDTLLESLELSLANVGTGKGTGCIVLTLDNPDALIDKHGHAAYRQILRRCGDRLTGALREEDTVGRLPGGVFGVALAPMRRHDLESFLQLAARLQHAVSEPFALGGDMPQVSASAGFCLAGRAPAAGGAALLEAAEQAADVARRHGAGSIRAYTPNMKVRSANASLDDELAEALENGEIIAYFQPQISTDTGLVSGFEVLARWQHPMRGLIPPSDFLPALMEAGLSERLSEVMLTQALAALRSWDAGGLDVPTIAINFSGDELRNPKLPAKLKWELDRFELEPGRLTLEILETVASDAQDDVIVQNIATLAAMGCGIDLDDFGTGHAAIGTIRRYTIRRIKIDRSFVSRVDQDRDQQRMIAAILSMAEQLGLETLAEGVETAGEHAMLAQLGCGHVQGFGIARPMPLSDTAIWIERHMAKLASAPTLNKRLNR